MIAKNRLRRRRGVPLGIAVVLLAGTIGAAFAESVSPNWLDIARRGIANSEYRIRWEGHEAVTTGPATFRAVNRAQGLRVVFSSEGVSVVPRAADPVWEWGVRPVGGVTRAGSTEPLRDGPYRVEYRRDGISERYLNSPRGVEQELELSSRRDSSAAPELRFEVHGNLLPQVQSDGRGIVFVTRNGQPALRYRLLEVTDSTGEPVESRIEWVDEAPDATFRIVIAGDGVPPLLIRAVISAAEWEYETDATGATLGQAVASAGDLNGDGFSDLLVGAPGYDDTTGAVGRVFVFHGSPSGLAVEPSSWLSGEQIDARFGASVGAAGDVNGDGYGDVIVGEPEYSNGEAGEGRAHVHLGGPDGLDAVANWTAEGDRAGASFGSAVGTAGDVDGDRFSDIVVGAAGYSDGQMDEGRAFVFTGSASGVAPEPVWSVEGNDAGARFGGSVGTAGDLNGDGFAEIVVCAAEAGGGRGFVHVYHGSVSGPSLTFDWEMSGTEVGDRLGASSSAAGDLDGDGYADLIVGAPGVSGGGSAIVVFGTTSGLSTDSVQVLPTSPGAGRFGVSVGTAGDFNGDGYADVIVGDDLHEVDGLPVGRAAIHFGSASGIRLQESWFIVGNEDGGLGTAVGSAGDVNGDGFADVVVGEPDFGSGGRVLVSTGAPAGAARQFEWETLSAQAGANYAHSLASAGDVNGDGYADVIVGADLFDGGFEDEGKAFVYEGSATGLSTVPSWTAEGEQAGANFGHVVASAGDVNGDGYDDILVSAYRHDNGEEDEGRAYVYLGSAEGVQAQASWVAEGDQIGVLFGGRLGSAGDVNGDGYSDVIVGAIWFNGGLPDEGAAFVYHGSKDGLSLAPDWSVEGEQIAAGFGVDAKGAGDVNGDGYSDVIVGAFLYDAGQFDEGRAYVYHGSPTGLSTTSAWSAEGDQVGAVFGHAVNTAGDVNGDGYSDVIVGAPAFDDGEQDEGAAFLYLGSPSGLSQAASWTAYGEREFTDFGFPVSSAGDLNGDGFADVVVGGPLWDNGAENVGRAWVYHGSSAGLSPVAAWTMEGVQPSEEFGFIVSSAGDVNGDGYAELLLGAHQYETTAPGAGRALMYYGNEGIGVAVRPRQRTVNSIGPLSRLGLADDPGAFRLDAVGRSAFGRGRVALEWEVKPLGVPFDGLGTGRSIGWFDTGVTGVSIEEEIAGLLDGTAHHWRLRMRYDPVTVPLLPAGRWLTVPWDGWQETDFRTPVALPAGEVPDGSTIGGAGIRLSRLPESSAIHLSWESSCAPGDDDYAVYSGELGRPGSHQSVVCSTGGATEATLDSQTGSRYYLIVPHNGNREGSYGSDSAGKQRPQGLMSCRVQSIDECGTDAVR